MKTLTCLFLSIALLSGCATASSYLFRDNPNLVSPARQMAEAYLNGQKNGETYKEASQKYGKGVIEFYGLKEYRYLEAGHFFYTPVLRYRIQATNQMGGVVWGTYDIGFSYDEKLASQESNNGLRIKEVYETLSQ